MRELDLSTLHEFESLTCNLGDQLGIIWDAQTSRLHHLLQISENVGLAWNGELDSNGRRYAFSPSANSASISRVHLQGLDASCLLTLSRMFFFRGPSGSTASCQETWLRLKSKYSGAKQIL